MLIDSYLENFHYNEKNSTVVSKEPEYVWPFIKNFDMAESGIIKALFSIRGLPDTMLSLDGFIESGFLLLDERKNEEIVLGLVSQPWKYKAGIAQIAPGDFKAFNDKGFVKVAWNFHVAAAGTNRTYLSTETRIFCADENARFKFSIYWSLISPFSRLTRIIMLNIIRKSAERN